MSELFTNQLRPAPPTTGGWPRRRRRRCLPEAHRRSARPHAPGGARLAAALAQRRRYARPALAAPRRAAARHRRLRAAARAAHARGCLATRELEMARDHSRLHRGVGRRTGSFCRTASSSADKPPPWGLCCGHGRRSPSFGDHVAGGPNSLWGFRTHGVGPREQRRDRPRSAEMQPRLARREAVRGEEISTAPACLLACLPKDRPFSIWFLNLVPQAHVDRSASCQDTL